MPSTRYYVGTGNVSVTGSWSTTRGGVGGASVPTTGDTAYIENVTHNLTGSLTGLALLVITGQRGLLGTPSTPLTISGTTLRLSTWADAYLTGDWSGAANILSTGSAVVRFGGTCTLALLQGGRSGTVTCDVGVTVTAYKSAGMRFDFDGDATGAPAATSGRMVGVLNSSRSVGTLDAKTASIVTLTGAAAATAILVDAGGKVVDNSSGVVAALEVMPDGQYTDEDNPYPNTITALTKWPGSEVVLRGPGGTTVTNPIVYVPAT